MRGGRVGFGEADREQSFKRLEEEILAELRRSFSPEFINRLDEVIVFNPLGSEELHAIVDILLDEINVTLLERGLTVAVDAEAKSWLLGEAGLDPSTGARPLRRTIQRHIQDPISEILISQPQEDVAFIEVTLRGDHLEFDPRPREALVTET